MPRKARILIIDDDDDYRASLRGLLEGEGYEVAEADSGAEGLALARADPPQLIILDVVMEHMGEGYSINQALKFSRENPELRHVPIVMVSAVQVDPTSLFGWIGDTAPITPDAYMTKPLDVPRFLESIRRLLTNRASGTGGRGEAGSNPHGEQGENPDCG